MQFTDDDLALVCNALFAYGLANADTAQGMRAQELYRLLKDAPEFHFTKQQPAPLIKTASRRQRNARDANPLAAEDAPKREREDKYEQD